jgi:aminomethyltransferase
MQGLKSGKQKYSLLLNAEGGVIDDLMAGKPDHDGLFVVVNAGLQGRGLRLLERQSRRRRDPDPPRRRALIAIQGPEAAEVMAAHEPVLAEFGFMDTARLMLFGVDCYVSRSGYTGEDGYEISVPAADAERIWNTILKTPASSRSAWAHATACAWRPACRCTATTSTRPSSPVEGALTFALSKSAPEAANFNGADRVLKELADGPGRVRVGLNVKEGAPAREGAEIADDRRQGHRQGHLGRPVADARPQHRHGLCAARVCRTWHGPEGHRARQGRRRRGRRHALRAANRYYRKPKA